MDSPEQKLDVVQRLRCTMHFPPDMECVKCESADEIERLRKVILGREELVK